VKSLAAYIRIARPAHWTKNVFVLPGVITALAMTDGSLSAGRATLGMLAVCLIASSNYVLNEILDAPTDRFHPSKCDRLISSGAVNVGLAWAEWLGLLLAGVALAYPLGGSFLRTLLLLWGMALAYNIRPVRTKDVPYLDVLTEAVNNPLRLLAGWFIVTGACIPPVSLLLCYWMIGCYFMAIKRFAEMRLFVAPAEAWRYRRSFGYYDEERLLVSIMFYAAASMLFFGAFVVRHRLELIMSFPAVALVLALYLRLGLKPNSPAAEPEKLIRERSLMVAVALCGALMLLLLVVDLPSLESAFSVGSRRW
jgi:4-hydroxybenzoate polyprenyltransferase